MQPTDGAITQVFGAHPEFVWQLGYGHLGCDWGAPVGTPIRAIADFVVIAADWGQNWPRSVTDRHTFVFGATGTGIGVLLQHEGWVGLGAHMSRTDLKVGQRGKRGDIIGYVGSTGNSTGPHLHKECMVPPTPWTPKFGRYNPLDQIALENRLAAAVALPANQRQNGPNPATLRSRAHSGGAAVGTITPGQRWNFAGYVIGQRVKIGTVESAVWFVEGTNKYVWAGMFTSQATAGLKNLTAPPVPAGTRKSGPAAVAYRKTPFILDNIDRWLPANTSFVFDAWTEGDEFAGSKVWFRGRENKFWAHSSLFTSQSTAGLTHVKSSRPAAPVPVPPALLINQRQLKPRVKGVMRLSPDVTKTNLSGRVAAAGSVENFTHFTRGQSVTSGGVTTDLWFKDSKEFAWAGGFTSQSTAGLVEWVPPSVPLIPPITDQPVPAYTFVKSVPLVTEVLPAKEGFFERGNFPADPVGIVVHEFNAATPEENKEVNHLTVHIGSLKNAFTTGSRVASAHFAVEGKEVVQFVHHTDRAYHGGPKGNDLLSIEVYGGMDAETIDTLVELIRQLEALYSKEKTLSKHSDHAATNCGRHVDLDLINSLVRKPAATAKEAFIQDIASIARNYKIEEK